MAIVTTQYHVTPEQFVKIIAALPPYSGPILLQWNSELTMNKGGRGGVERNPYIGRVTMKHSKIVIITSESYADRVRTEQEKAGHEADFVARKSWGEPLTEYGFKTCATFKRSKSGEIYLVYYEAMADDYTAEFDDLLDYENEAPEYYLDGKLLSDDERRALFTELEPWLPKRKDEGEWKESSTQAAAGVDTYAHQQYRNVALSSVDRIIMERNEYIFDK